MGKAETTSEKTRSASKLGGISKDLDAIGRDIGALRAFAQRLAQVPGAEPLRAQLAEIVSHIESHRTKALKRTGGKRARHRAKKQ